MILNFFKISTKKSCQVVIEVFASTRCRVCTAKTTFPISSILPPLPNCNRANGIILRAFTTVLFVHILILNNLQKLIIKYCSGKMLFRENVRTHVFNFFHVFISIAHRYIRVWNLNWKLEHQMKRFHEANQHIYKKCSNIKNLISTHNYFLSTVKFSTQRIFTISILNQN